MQIFRYYPHNQSAQDKEIERKIFNHSIFFSAMVVFVLWLFFLLSEIFQYDMVRWGIYPLHTMGLPGILTSPFVHSGYNHLISNSVSLFILLFTLIYFYRSYSYRILFQIYLISGICVWLGGREAWHIGASGVVYGLAAFHFLSGIIRNDVRLLTMSVIVVFLYGGMVWGMLPIKPEISWESHLWGAMAGVFLAIFYRRYSVKRLKYEWEDEPDEPEEPNGENPEQDTQTTETQNITSNMEQNYLSSHTLQFPGPALNNHDPAAQKSGPYEML